MRSAVLRVGRIAGICLVAWGLVTWGLLAGAMREAHGELPVPRLDRLTPLGTAAGATVTVEVVGADLEEASGLRFDHSGLTAHPVAGKERQFQVAVAADVPAGTYDVWVVGRFGISNPRLFAVTRGLVDVTEQEPNNAADKAQAVAVNCAIHGTSDQNDQDTYRVGLRAGQRVTIQCYAARLDSPLDANLSLSNVAGVVLASNGDYWGRDPLLDFVAPHDGDYLVAINDLSFRGGHPYRLVISDHPQIENAFPRAVRAGQGTDVAFFGRNFPAEATAVPRRIGDLPLSELRRSVTPPGDVWGLGTYRFLEHPTAHSTQPTAATCTLLGFTAATGLADALNDAVPLVVVDQAVTTELEPNSNREQAQVLSLPAVVSGRFDEPRDADWYEVVPPENGAYAVEVYCERIGGRADPYVAVYDEQGNRVTELDDYGHRVNAFDGHLRDPSGSVNLTAGKKYRLLVQDRYSRGGPRYHYVLKVAANLPDFFVAAIHSQNPGPAGLNLRRGGTAWLDVVVHQVGGFNGPVTITAQDLPAGIQLEPTTIHGTSGVVVLYASADAPECLADIRLVASGARGDQLLQREVRPYTRVWNDASQNSSRPMRSLPLAVRGQAPFALAFAAPKLQIAAGKQGEARLTLARLWPEFQGPVTALPLSLPGNLRIANLELAAGATEATVGIEVPAGTRPGLYTVTLNGQAQVPFSKDPQAKNPPNTLVTLPARPLQLEVVPANP